MTTTQPHASRRPGPAQAAVLAWTALAAVAAALVVPTAATAATPAPRPATVPRGVGPAEIAARAANPGLVIGVDDGRATARDGDHLTYAITVTNRDRTAARGVRLTQTVPTGLRFASADRNGKFAHGQVAWTVDLPAGGTIDLHTATVLMSAPAQLARLATVACVITRSAARPTVCAADLDRLPAHPGTASGANSHPNGSSWITSWWVWLSAVGGAAAIGVTMARFKRRPDAPTDHLPHSEHLLSHDR